MDALALAKSDEREIHAILDRLTPDTWRGAEQILADMGFPESSYDPAVESWAQAQYDRGTAEDHEEWEYRWWADEPRGCRCERAYA
jgi:hypothetical protein